MWVYIKSDTNLWTVGFFDPNGTWRSDEDFDTKKAARARVNYLNGGSVVNIE